MHRRFSTLVKSASSSSGTSPINEKTFDDDNDSKASTILRSEPLPVPSLKVKRVDNYYSRWSKSRKYRVRLQNRHVWRFDKCNWYLCRTQAPSIQLRPSQSCKLTPMMRGKTLALCKETLCWLNESSELRYCLSESFELSVKERTSSQPIRSLSRASTS